MANCSSCGAKYEPDDLFCSECGLNLQLDKTTKESDTIVVGTVDLSTVGDDVLEKFSTLLQESKKLNNIEQQKITQENRYNELSKQMEEVRRYHAIQTQRRKNAKKRVDKLNGFTFTSIWAKITGSHQEKLQKAEELLYDEEAKLEEANASIQDLSPKLQNAETQLRSAMDLFNKKKEMDRQIAQIANTVMDQVAHPEEDKLEMQVKMKKSEYDPVRQKLDKIQTGLNYLQAAEKSFANAVSKLSSARSMADYDMWGMGDMMADLSKQSSYSDARREVYNGNMHVNNARNVLGEGLPDLHIEELGSMDMWFDNIFTDMRAKEKIEKAQRAVERHLMQLREHIQYVRGQRGQLATKEAQLRREWEDLYQKLLDMRIELMAQAIGQKK